MEKFSCIIRDIFHTSIGEIFVLEFSSEVIPKIGHKLRNENKLEWKVKGVGMNSKFHNPDNKYSAKVTPNLLWDCSLESYNHNGKLQNGEILYSL